MAIEYEEFNAIHPHYYGQLFDKYELIDYLLAKDEQFAKLIALKYYLRAGNKRGNSEKQDLLKAKYYLEHKDVLKKETKLDGISNEDLISRFEYKVPLFKMSDEELLSNISKRLETLNDTDVEYRRIYKLYYLCEAVDISTKTENSDVDRYNSIILAKAAVQYLNKYIHNDCGDDAEDSYCNLEKAQYLIDNIKHKREL